MGIPGNKREFPRINLKGNFPLTEDAGIHWYFFVKLRHDDKVAKAACANTAVGLYCLDMLILVRDRSYGEEPWPPSTGEINYANSIANSHENKNHQTWIQW